MPEQVKIRVKKQPGEREKKQRDSSQSQSRLAEDPDVSEIFS